jgi:hypothetical protein
MSAYTISYSIRYVIPSLSQQIEVAVVHCIEDIKNEEPSAPDHSNRAAWATWANKNSALAYEPFRWPVAMNPAIGAYIEADPSGATVPDGDVQFVVNSNLNFVIADFVSNPPVTRR